MLNGLEAIKKSNEEMRTAGWKVVEFIPTTLSVMSCGELITEIGKFEIAFSMEGVKTPMRDTGKYPASEEKE
jgi:hypothetical protein